MDRPERTPSERNGRLQLFARDRNGFTDDVHGWSFIPDKVDGEYAKHGTHVAGTVARVVEEASRYAGTRLPVEIMVVKTVPAGDENDKDVALAIRYAADNDNRDLEKYTYYPGPYRKNGKLRRNMVTVGASDKAGLPASFSNYGSRSVDFFAPGVKIHAPIRGNRHADMSGTSMASPVVAGMAAVQRSCFPDLKAWEIKGAMTASAKNSPAAEAFSRQKSKPGVTGYRKLCRTGGIIDLGKCLRWLQERQ